MSTQSGLLRASGLGLAALLSVSAVVSTSAEGPGGRAGLNAGATIPRERVILFKNDQLVRGVVTEDGEQYHVVQRLGMIHLPKTGVEGVFDSLEDVYQHKLERLPQRDTAERMKLVHWCQNQMLREEAKQQLREIVIISPKHSLAKSMLSSMEQTDALVVQRQLDPEVRQTRGGEAAMVADRVEALDNAGLGRAQRAMGIGGFPVIFDLPRPMAIKRSQEFVQFVHPILQKKCVRCHDGGHVGKFQLVPMKTKADRTVEAYRANLDAVLQLVDAKNAATSELLSSSLRPHGNGPDKRPIFVGSNDPAYQILAKWVHNVSSPGSAVATNAVGRSTNGGGGEEGFGVERDRARTALGQLGPDGRPIVAGMPGSAKENRDVLPSRQYRELAGMMVEEEPAAADPKEFPLPYAISGVKPAMPGDPPVVPPGRPALKSRGIVPPNAAAAKGAKPNMGRDAAVTPAGATVVTLPDAKEEAELAEAIKALPKNGAKKPVKISQDVLMKLLNRGPVNP